MVEAATVATEIVIAATAETVVAAHTAQHTVAHCRRCFINNIYIVSTVR